MKRLNLIIFCVLLLNFSVFAQIGGTTQRGRATHDMDSEGFFAAHNSFPLGATIRVVNTLNGREINAVINDRIPASPDRIVDLSFDVWDALGLTEGVAVMLVYTPSPAARQTPASAEPAARAVNIAETADIREITRLKPTQPLYHLLILDRRNSAANSDISDLQNIQLIFKFSHGKNGYLIAIFVSTTEGPVFPVMPDRSRILVNLMTTDLAFIRDYTNSTAFNRFVTNPEVVAQLRAALK
jgi:rare lipoprotein A